MSKDTVLGPPVEVAYERIFNLGNYEHEKFVITKYTQADTEYAALKQMAVKVVDLEHDMALFREALQSWYSIKQKIIDNTNGYTTLTAEEKAKLVKELKDISIQIYDFKTKHTPLVKPCNCAFCKEHAEDESNA